ncbi:MAG: tRNA adenosine(34) deaminase TadA [Lachnospiraceae bacterium]|nr:tRNA adenosine(34) deaminase TadA [Lachnospiraceae bacterium]
MGNKFYMREAIRLAKKAEANGDVPIGCVIVQDDRIIGRGYNRRMKDKDATSHAEIAAIRSACRATGDWRLDGCEMYVTLEPCQMCAGAIVQARIKKIYIGCMNPKAGCAGSVLNLLEVDRFNHQAEIEQGMLEEECSALMKNFFVRLRKKKIDIQYE